MPNRIIKESVCLSESLLPLSWFEEVFFYRLLVCCDDYGCFDAREKVLKGRMFPLHDISSDQVREALLTLAREGLILLYEQDGLPFLQVVNWRKHQKVRNKRSKYPLPPGYQPDPRDEGHGDFYCPKSVGENNLSTIVRNCPSESVSQSVSQSQSQSQSLSLSNSQPEAYCEDILSFLNEKCKTQFPCTKSTRALIVARLQEGYTPEDFLTVISKKHKQWSENPVMVGYLRPQTLFSAKNFGSYLREPSAAPAMSATSGIKARHPSEAEKIAITHFKEVFKRDHGG